MELSFKSYNFGFRTLIFPFSLTSSLNIFLGIKSNKLTDIQKSPKKNLQKIQTIIFLKIKKNRGSQWKLLKNLDEMYETESIGAMNFC